MDKSGEWKDPMSISLPIAIGIAVILGFEWTMWKLFLRRVQGVHFPRDLDKSHLRFFSIGRIRMCAIMHTSFLAVVLIIASFLAW